MLENTFTLSLEDPVTQQILFSGWHRGRRVVARAVSEPIVLFEYIESDLRPARHRILPWLQTVRAFSLTATGTPCLAVFALSGMRGDHLWIGTGLSALAGVLFLQIAINVLNDVEDYRRLIDLPGTLGGSGVIQKGWWTPEYLRKIAWVSLLLGTVLGLPAFFGSPIMLLPIALMAGTGVLFYSARKGGFKYLALGELVVWVLCGPALALGFSLALTNSWNSGVFWLGSFFGFLAAALLHVNNLQDMEVDRRRGVDTLAIRLGFKGSIRLLIAFYLLAVLSIDVGVLLRALPLGALTGGLVTVVFAFPWLKKVRLALGPESSLLSGCRVKAAKTHLIGGVSLIFGLGLGWLTL